jgi:hypothetical protein
MIRLLEIAAPSPRGSTVVGGRAAGVKARRSGGEGAAPSLLTPWFAQWHVSSSTPSDEGKEEFEMRCWKRLLAGSALLLGASVQAATFTFEGDPFAGSDALTTPGRQVVGGEPTIVLTAPPNIFSFQGGVFGAIVPFSFANGVIADVPPAGTNVVVLRTFDDDNNAATPFGAGNAANLIAERITTSGPGLFVYFNSALMLPRLVYSTNLSENTADLKILARMTLPGGSPGQQGLEQFSAANFTFVASPIPEPSTLVLLGSGAALLAFVRRGQKRQRRTPA